jgi:putative oxidoreductase
MHQRTTAKDYALLALRLAGLYLALGHGLGKIIALTSGQDWWINTVTGLGLPLPVLFAWAAALSEFIGGLCLALGLFTRVAAFFIACTMATATFLRHGAITQFLAWIGLSSATPEELRSLGDPERAILFLLIAIALLILDGGELSLERKIAERRR